MRNLASDPDLLLLLSSSSCCGEFGGGLDLGGCEGGKRAKAESVIHHSSFVLLTLWLDGFQILLLLRFLIFIPFSSLSTHLFFFISAFYFVVASLDVRFLFHLPFDRWLSSLSIWFLLQFRARSHNFFHSGIPESKERWFNIFCGILIVPYTWMSRVSKMMKSFIFEIGGGANRPKCSRTRRRVWPAAAESAESAEAWAAARRNRSKVAGSISMMEECTAAVGRTEKHTDTASAPVSKARENTPVPGTTVLKFPVFTPGQGKKKKIIFSSFWLFIIDRVKQVNYKQSVCLETHLLPSPPQYQCQ